MGQVFHVNHDHLSDKEQLAWAAGIFEGEGTVTKGRDRPGWWLAVRMTDEDIIRQLAVVLGGMVYGPYDPDDGVRKPVWVWKVGGPGAERVARLLYPYLGERRQAAISRRIDPSAEQLALDETREEHEFAEGWDYDPVDHQ